MDKPAGLRRIRLGVRWRFQACVEWVRATAGKITTRRDRNQVRLCRLINKHRGERAFIVASGPSLRISDLDRLKGEITFACNKIYLTYDKTRWRPTYYTVLDVLVAQQNQEAIRNVRARKIFPTDVFRYFEGCNDITWVKELGQRDTSAFRFSSDLRAGVYGGWTVVYTQMQLALGMGIRQLYLIGLDYSFVVPATTGEVCAQGPVLESKGEVNHFDPRYRVAGEKWTMPRLDLQYKAFVRARDAFAQCGGTIRNASRKTALDVFPCVNLDSVLE